MHDLVLKFKNIFNDRRMIFIFLLGMVSGLPLLLTSSTLSVWLLEEGLSKSAIGTLSLVGLPYTLKFFWAPFFDYWPLPFITRLLGQRRSYIFFAQIMLCASLLGLSLSDPRTTPWLTAMWALLTAFFSASQDIGIDAYRVEILDEKSYATGAATVVFGYRIGMLIAGAGSLYLATFFSWHAVYFSMAMLMLILALVSLFLSQEPKTPRQSLPKKDMRPASLYASWQALMANRSWLSVVLLILFYKLGDAFLTSMSNVFFLESGFSKIEIANVVKVFGLVATLAGGFIAAFISQKKGLLASMLICGVIHSLANLIFVVQATVGYNLPLLFLTIGIENVTAGMTGVALVAYISSLCHGSSTATHYALLSSVMAMSRSLLSSFAGFFATQLGWTYFFILCSIITVPALIIVLHMMRQLKTNNSEIILSHS